MTPPNLNKLNETCRLGGVILCVRALCTRASAQVLPADRGYEINDILAYAASAGMETVMPPKKNRREQRRSIADGRKRDDPLEISNMDFYQS